MEHERLRRLLRGLVKHGHLLTGGVQVGKRHECRHAPRDRLGPDLRLAELVADIARLGEHGQDLLEGARPTRPIRADEDPRERGGVLEATCEADGVPSHESTSLALTLEVERAGETAEKTDPNRGVGLAQPLGSLLEELDRALVDDARAPAGILVADGRTGEELGVALLAADLGRCSEGVQRVRRMARAVTRLAELEQDLDPAKWIVDREVERGAESIRSL